MTSRLTLPKALFTEPDRMPFQTLIIYSLNTIQGRHSCMTLAGIQGYRHAFRQGAVRIYNGQQAERHLVHRSHVRLARKGSQTQRRAMRRLYLQIWGTRSSLV